MFGATLVRKHMAAFLLLVAVPVACVILVISFMFRREAVRIARERTTEAVERSARALDAEALGFALFTSALVNDGVLQARARAYASASDPEARYAAARDIEASIAWFFRITSRIGTVILFFDDGGRFVYTNYQTSGIDPEGARALCADPRRPDGEVWCLDDLEVLPSALEKPPVLSMAVRPRPGDAADSNIESILVSFRIPALDAIAVSAAAETDAGSGDARGGVVLVANRAGTVMLSDRRSMKGRSFAEVAAELEPRSLVIGSRIESIGWTFAEAIPLRVFTRNVDLMTRWVFAAFALVGLLFVLYTRSFFGDIVNPLRAVIARMGSVAEGDFSARADEAGPVEFRRLGAAFNLMVSRIDELTRQIVAEQKERTRTEIEALRFQLNPHFICNTLNAIGMMASIAKADSIKRMTTALTRIMRETLSADDTIFPLEEELKNLESYVYIMKIRFGDTFSYSTEIEDGLACIGVPTMLLQPLVENAVLHGLRGLPPGRSIVVGARREGEFVRLEVRDDGIGMEAERLASLFSGPREGGRGFNRIGLYNVRRRILLSFDPPCNLAVESFPGAGTIVSLLIPLLAAPAARADARTDARGEAEAEAAT
ncbi:MAG: hypothetical protein A2Y36_05595 [Treponema sp. GWA1_62_8]|nr:MAG: hypothetical protein A2001_09415 [Treponema sp. GWC1_61_84]OHE67060.1 MAG: hypothetical protein A2Y36_05595 [Treponema sp. GWA1_62_8]